MITNRLLYLLIFTAILLITACSPQTIPANQASEPKLTSTSKANPTTVQSTTTATTIAEMSGEFEANGHSLFIKCLGTGSPTIVLELGENNTVSVPRILHEKLAERTMTCAYNRANIGRSGSAPTPRTAEDVTDDLRALLVAAKVPGPYLLMGYSAGGMLVQHYARTYPDQLIGLVAMNPVPPAHPWLDEVSQIFTAPEFAGEESYYKGGNAETLDYLTSSEQIATAPEPTNLPFEMIISTDVQCEGGEICLKSYKNYEQIMREVTAVWPKGNFSQVVAEHTIFPDNLDAVLAAVERVLGSP